MANKNAYSRFYGGSLDNLIQYMLDDLHGSAFITWSNKFFGLSFKEDENKGFSIFLFVYDVSKNFIGKSSRFNGPKNSNVLKTILKTECNKLA